jgi:hypothetical protein
MGRVLSLPPYALAAARARLERERAGLKHFLMTVESVLEEHEVFDIEPWLHGLQERIAEYDARIARYA